MSDPGAIPLGLAQQKAARPVDPEQLEMMGKRAAALHTSQGLTLSNSVVEIVKEAFLAPEQVKRVCEFANTAAYLSEFEKSGQMRNVTFEGGPADPGRVLQDLNDGSNPAVHQIKHADYSPPAGSYKDTQPVVADEEAAFAAAFGVLKTAEVDHHAHSKPIEEVYALRVRLEGMRDDMLSKLSSSQVLFDTIKEDLCQATKQEVLDGSSLADVSQAWAGYTPSAERLGEAIKLACDYLREHQVMDRDNLVGSLSKTAAAGSIPNPEHPVVERFIAFTKVAQKHSELQSAIELVNEQLQRVNTQLKELA